MRDPCLKTVRMIAAVLSAGLLLVACEDGEPAGLPTTSTSPPSTGEAKVVEDVVRAALQAQSDDNVEAFLALWTDNGLEAYDVGTRAELESAQREDFGANALEVVGFSDTRVEGDVASTLADAVMRHARVAKTIFRLRFHLVRQEASWLLDGFEFAGSPPPRPGQRVVSVQAQDYAFALDTPEAPPNVAFKLVNVGQEPHELTLFKGPDGVDVQASKNALQNVDGADLARVPDGYQGDHLGFVQPGQTSDVTLAQPLERGTYVLACYIPQGGFTAEGEAVNADGRPHIQLGMIAVLAVK